MSFQAFCKVDGIQGESQNAAHKDWIAVLSYNHDMRQRGGADQGLTTGHPGGRAEIGEFTITKRVDKSSPYLALSCAGGDPIKTVEVNVSLASKEEVVYMKYTMTNVVIFSISPDGEANDEKHVRPTETVSFRFSHIKWEYQQVGDDGRKVGAAITSQWNLATNKSASPS